MPTCNSGGASKGGSATMRTGVESKVVASTKSYDAMTDLSDRLDKATTREEVFRIMEIAGRSTGITDADYLKLDQAATRKAEELKYGKTGSIKKGITRTIKSGKTVYDVSPTGKFSPAEVRGMEAGTTINFGLDWKYVKTNADTWRIYRKGKRQPDRSTADIIYVVAT